MLDDPELDPRIAAAYDGDRPWTDDFDFFLGLAAGRVVDLGCGTGTLTTAIARAGHEVVGVDPNPSFLAIARAKPGGELARWIRGTSVDLPSAWADVAVMTSNAAQVFITDDDFDVAVRDLRRSLVPGGILAFDTRDPVEEAWRTWPSEIRDELPDGTFMDMVGTTSFVDDVWAFDGTVLLSSVAGAAVGDPGTTWSRTVWRYRFRSETVVRDALDRADFRVDAIDRVAGELVVVATAV